LLESAGVEFDIIEYLKSPPTEEGFEDLVRRLDRPPADLVRKDSRFHALELDRDDYQTPQDVARLLSQHPALMQRPLIDDGENVIVARPLARATEWLAAQGAS
jgi:arsenate reductase